MKLLNSKSILDCTELEIEIHEQENKDVIKKICSMKNCTCLVTFRCVDEAHKNQVDYQRLCELYDFMEMIEFTDYKNGIDFAADENNVFTIIVYGQGYELNGIYYLVETHISIFPL